MILWFLAGFVCCAFCFFGLFGLLIAFGIAGLRQLVTLAGSIAADWVSGAL